MAKNIYNDLEISKSVSDEMIFLKGDQIYGIRSYAA